jgi:hypothetical protein
LVRLAATILAIVFLPDDFLVMNYPVAGRLAAIDALDLLISRQRQTVFLRHVMYRTST